jgi:crotonobetainyl-CoA:carnitine CoA-transferase CaiB-like acyl-CoA transferase
MTSSSPTPSTPAQPLAGVRVLDLSRVLAGPWCTQNLADLGADVIKVERPMRDGAGGDDTRGWGPPFLKGRDGQDTAEAAYFLGTNRNKRSITVDIAHPEGQALIRRLVAQCDVFIENFKVGDMARYGLDAATLRAINPKLIYCSITGFGQHGPYAQRAGYDFMIQGMGGIMSVTGQPDGEPGAEPMKVGVAFADIFTGLYAVIGMLAALSHRERTGEGQQVDLALLDCQVAVLANQALNFLVGGQAPTRLGNAHPNIVPYQTFKTRDGHIIIAVGTDRQFREFCRLAGIAHIADDPRFSTNRGRVENRKELVSLLIDPIKTRSTGEWIALLEAAAVPCGPINRIDEVFADPQVIARGIQIALSRPDGAVTPGVANPIRLSATPIDYNRAPPALGDGTATVLKTVLGLAEGDVEALRDSGVIG